MDDYTQSTGQKAYEGFKEIMKFHFGLPSSNRLTFKFSEEDLTCFIKNKDEVYCEFIATNSEEWQSITDFFSLIQGMRDDDDVEVSRIMNEAVETAVVLRVRRVLENMMQNNGQGSPKKKKNRCSFM